MTVSRRHALIGLSAAGATLAPGQAGALIEQNDWAPTELGRKLISMLPAHAAAIYEDVNTVDAKWAPEYDAAKVAKVKKTAARSDRQINAVAKAILKAPVTKPAQITDRAIAWAALGAEEPYGYGVMADAVEQTMLAILVLGGVSENECSVHRVYDAHKQQMLCIHDGQPTLSKTQPMRS